MTTTIVDPLFKSAREALVFALNFSSQQYDRPAMSKAAAQYEGVGRGLGGLDGAAQSGMIRQELMACGRLYEAILIVQFAPRGIPCSCRSACCSGNRPNRERQDALNVVTMDAVKALSGCTSDYRSRAHLVEAALLHKKPGISKMVEEGFYGGDKELHRNTLTAHNAKIRAWLHGERTQDAQTFGMEQRAWDAFASRINTTGMVGA